MKKLTRIFLIASAICLGGGIILFTIGIKMGAATKAWNLLSTGFPFGNSNIAVNLGSDDNETDAEVVNQNGESAFATYEIKNIEVAIGAAHTIIKPSSDDRIHVINNSNQKINVYISNDKLKIESDDDNVMTNVKGTISIEIPEGLKLDNLDMDYGAAEVESEGDYTIECRRFTLDLGAGDVKLNGIKAHDAEINVGAGNVVLNKTYTVNMDADLGMGAIEYQGDVSGDMEIDCSMGSVDMELDSRKEDHNYEYNVSAGSLRIDNEECAGFESVRSGNADVDSNYEIDCSMGSVSLRFAKII